MPWSLGRRRPISAEYPGEHLPEVHTTGSFDNIKNKVFRPHIRVLCTRTLHSVTGREMKNDATDYHFEQENMGMCEYGSQLMSWSTPIEHNDS